uniref:Uncharacterized protein n=1 Tax=Plectus sambesii TaxID=2011161 RepID=A0A914WTQ4_9BILA
MLQLKVGATKQRIEKLKGQLSELYPRKSHLLDGYNKQRASYTRWSRQAKQGTQFHQASVPRLSYKSVSLPSSRSKYPTPKQDHRKPTHFKTIDGDGEQFDEERLEPFHEQKSRCRRLINYLHSLLQQLDAPTLAELHAELDDQAIDKIARPPLEKAASSDSADDLPEGFTRLRRPVNADTPAAPASSQLAPSSPKHKKRGSKKSSKKATQPISHSVELYQSFAELGVEVPSVYQDVPLALKAITDQLNFYEHQTNLPNADDPLDPYGLRDLHFDYPPSESDVTSDSGAWNGSFYSTDRSESASQFSLSQSAIVSPGDPADGVRPLSFLMSPPISPTDDNFPIASPSGALTREQLRRSLSKGLTAADSEHVIDALNNVALTRQPTNDEGIDATGYGSKESSANSISGPLLTARQSSGIGVDESGVRL